MSNSNNEGIEYLLAGDCYLVSSGMKNNTERGAALGITRAAYEKRLKNWTKIMTDDNGVEWLVSPKHCMVKPVKVVL